MGETLIREGMMKGLYDKYIIQKASGKPLEPSFYAIVLRIDGGRYLDACRAGVTAFAESVRGENPLLADDIQAKLRELLPLEDLEEQPQAPSQLVECTEENPCCDLRGVYNGFGSGPLKFICPKHCPCHD